MSGVIVARDGRPWRADGRSPFVCPDCLVDCDCLYTCIDCGAQSVGEPNGCH